MPNITLPDGNKLKFSKSITGFEIAEKISKSLSKQALIVSVNGKLKDLDYKIENKMKEIVDRDEKTYREVWKRNDAIEHFKKKGELYKAEIIESIPEGEDVSLYFHGDWHDLCRGPHLTSTGKIGKYFKLTKVSGAYWRGCLLYTSPSPRDS